MRGLRRRYAGRPNAGRPWPRAALAGPTAHRPSRRGGAWRSCGGSGQLRLYRRRPRLRGSSSGRLRLCSRWLRARGNVRRQLRVPVCQQLQARLLQQQDLRGLRRQGIAGGAALRRGGGQRRHRQGCGHE
mmetsp:Transcript_60773/g.157652  ORF Transcript_60773/g.157652 Transcript_60773/m.157652 type:complete len:130 (-) Transcript_60773:125-514(-)